ncbi:hypothetical protein MFIFM68171_05736 [Madurella fahalii]|uniref:T6SS Phospholipase effector Tle1-like catalytic domain-containing protein n=1 Tax=Madurella fahalii TaxID=1157608 RepID=A0ABQ0GCN3_9PEZI
MESANEIIGSEHSNRGTSPSTAHVPGATRQPIVILCDGTWCGRETGTETNIYRLANIFGIPTGDPDSEDEHKQTQGNIIGRYRNGVGLNSTLIDYFFNGITAQDLAVECTSVYKFIVEHYTPDHEIWLFGLSRGAYTVRCVAGMINNCGILKLRDGVCPHNLDTFCKAVYRRYRSRHLINHPRSEQSIQFRRAKSWPLIGDEEEGEPRRPPPVRFMGILDTVGSLGIPNFTGGVGLEWPEFYDNVVSSVVQEVGHLVSQHDRLYIFQPCLASRKCDRHQRPEQCDSDCRASWGIREHWLPGMHYDLGRQRFRFWRIGTTWMEKWFARCSLVVEPNQVLADLALYKMLTLMPEINDARVEQAVSAQIALLSQSMRAPGMYKGSGDVYDKILEYGPFGRLLRKWRALYWGIEKLIATAPALWELFFARRCRLIPDAQATVFDYDVPFSPISETRSFDELADISAERYPSNAVQVWRWARA